MHVSPNLLPTVSILLSVMLLSGLSACSPDGARLNFNLALEPEHAEVSLRAAITLSMGSARHPVRQRRRLSLPPHRRAPSRLHRHGRGARFGQVSETQTSNVQILDYEVHNGALSPHAANLALCDRIVSRDDRRLLFAHKDFSLFTTMRLTLPWL